MWAPGQSSYFLVFSKFGLDLQMAPLREKGKRIVPCSILPLFSAPLLYLVLPLGRANRTNLLDEQISFIQIDLIIRE